MERGLGERASRWVVSSYGSYVEVQRAVDHLGRVGYGRTALQGAASGAPVGILFGLFSLIVPLVPALILALYGLVFGAVLGLSWP